MKLKIKRIDKELPLPSYQTAGSAAFDLMARVDTTIEPHALGKIPGNIIVQVPRGYFMVLASRSSTPGKFGLSTPHGIGVLDSDYSGPNDEAIIQVYNFTDKPVTINRGTRIAQALILKTEHAELEEVEEMTSENRGGFGSTGH